MFSASRYLSSPRWHGVVRENLYRRPGEWQDRSPRLFRVTRGKEVLQTVRGHSEIGLGARVRVLWSGAESNWVGEARFTGATIKAMGNDLPL